VEGRRLGKGERGRGALEPRLRYLPEPGLGVVVAREAAGQPYVVVSALGAGFAAGTPVDEPAVAEQVRRNDGVLLGQQLDHLVPLPGAAGNAVDQDDRRALAGNGEVHAVAVKRNLHALECRDHPHTALTPRGRFGRLGRLGRRGRRGRRILWGWAGAHAPHRSESAHGGPDSGKSHWKPGHSVEPALAGYTRAKNPEPRRHPS